MKRKILALALALVMCLTLFPLTASAAVTFSFNKAEYDVAETITVKVTGLTEQQKADRLCLYLYKVGAPNSDYIYSQEIFPIDDGTYNFNWTSESGMHEIRLMDLHRNVVYATSQPIPVGVILGGGDVKLNKTAYTAGEEIIITVTGITEQMEAARAAVYIYKEDAKHGDYGSWAAVPAGTSVQKLTAPHIDGAYFIRLYSNGRLHNDDTFVMSMYFTVSGAVNASSWAKADLAKAGELGLIPAVLKDADFTKPITRAEFAAVAVKVFENLTGEATTPSSPGTFTDTREIEVLKAHNTGLMVGITDTTFGPQIPLNRETAATALTRVLKRAYIPDWSFATDGNFKLNYTKPAAFADDAQISGWAKDSVYFMAANDIIKGMGENKFAPRAITTAEQAANYAVATREQAIIIGLRLVENLKGKPLNFTQN